MMKKTLIGLVLNATGNPREFMCIVFIFHAYSTNQDVTLRLLENAWQLYGARLLRFLNAFSVK